MEIRGQGEEIGAEHEIWTMGPRNPALELKKSDLESEIRTWGWEVSLASGGC